MKRHSNAVGFCSLKMVEGFSAWNGITCTAVNDCAAAAMLFRRRLSSDPRVTAVIQTAVPDDLRHQHHALALVDQLTTDAARDGRSIVQAWCRANLPAMEFWRRAGFTAVAVKHTTAARGIPLVLWRRPTCDTAVDLLDVRSPRRRQGNGGRFLRDDEPDETAVMLVDPRTPLVEQLDGRGASREVREIIDRAALLRAAA